MDALINTIHRLEHEFWVWESIRVQRKYEQMTEIAEWRERRIDEISTRLRGIDHDNAAYILMGVAERLGIPPSTLLRVILGQKAGIAAKHERIDHGT